MYTVVIVLAMMSSCIEMKYNHRGDEECFLRALRLVFCGINHYQITSPHSLPELRIIT